MKKGTLSLLLALLCVSTTANAARFYHADAGRFLQRDSVESEAPYSYTRNNPLVHTDPSGHTMEDALIVYADYGNIEDGQFVRDGEGWAGYHAANNVAGAWMEQHERGATHVYGAKDKGDIESIIGDFINQQQTFGLILFLGHSGEVDGLRLSGEKMFLNDLPEELLDSLPQGPSPLPKYNGWMNGWWSARQDGVIRVQLFHSYPSDSAQVEFYHPTAKFLFDDDLQQLTEPNGFICFGGCNSDKQAKEIHKTTGRNTMGSNQSLNLQSEVAPMLREWIMTGNLHPFFQTFTGDP